MAFGQSTVSPEDAINHVGEHAMVCGKVAGTMQFVKSPARSLFLYLDRPYPTPVFMALIPGRDLPNFHDPRSLNGQNICVKGLIKNHKGKAAIVVKEPSQISKQ
jgi:DNA/RNA endonuclease YhcR with UshA esterase domain